MIDQIAIAVLGATAIGLTQSKDVKVQRYACLFGLAGQPFWFYMVIHGEQWGAFAATVLYTAAWMKGLWTYWIRKTP